MTSCGHVLVNHWSTEKLKTRKRKKDTKKITSSFHFHSGNASTTTTTHQTNNDKIRLRRPKPSHPANNPTSTNSKHLSIQSLSSKIFCLQFDWQQFIKFQLTQFDQQLRTTESNTKFADVNGKCSPKFVWRPEYYTEPEFDFSSF